MTSTASATADSRDQPAHSLLSGRSVTATTWPPAAQRSHAAASEQNHRAKAVSKRGRPPLEVETDHRAGHHRLGPDRHRPHARRNRARHGRPATPRWQGPPTSRVETHPATPPTWHRALRPEAAPRVSPPEGRRHHVDRAPSTTRGLAQRQGEAPPGARGDPDHQSRPSTGAVGSMPMATAVPGSTRSRRPWAGAPLGARRTRTVVRTRPPSSPGSGDGTVTPSWSTRSATTSSASSHPRACARSTPSPRTGPASASPPTSSSRPRSPSSCCSAGATIPRPCSVASGSRPI